MSSNEQLNQSAAQHYDRMMQEIEQVDPNAWYSLVPGSRLHEYINNPVTEGFDED